MNNDELTDWFTTRRVVLNDIARRIVGSVATAEDVVQDAWLKASTSDLAALRSPYAWFATTVRHLAIDRVRHQRMAEAFAESWVARSTAAGGEPSIEDLVAVRAEAAAALARMVATLSGHEVATIVLREVFDEDYATLAQLSRKTIGATRVMVHRALDRLRREPRPARRERDDAEDEERAQTIYALCWQAIEQRDATLLHETLVSSTAPMTMSMITTSMTAIATTAIATNATACASTAHRIRCAIVFAGGRYRLALRQGDALVCAFPVGTRSESHQVDATID